MNVFNQIRVNLPKIRSLVMTFVIALACLGVAVACAAAFLDGLVGITGSGSRVTLGDGLLCGFAVVYMTALGCGGIVFGQLTRKMVVVTYRELDKLHDEWATPAAPQSVVLGKYDSWVNPQRAGALFQEGKIDAPEYVLLSMYFINSAAISRIYDLARGRGTTEEERAAISLMQEVSRVLDPKGRTRPFRRQQTELTRN
jgi:hypothetical protein